MACNQFFSGDVNTNVCRFQNSSCSIQAQMEYTKRYFAEQCACLPDCRSISYNMETSQIKVYHSEIGDELRDKYIRNKYT